MKQAVEDKVYLNVREFTERSGLPSAVINLLLDREMVQVETFNGRRYIHRDELETLDEHVRLLNQPRRKSS